MPAGQAASAASPLTAYTSLSQYEMALGEKLDDSARAAYIEQLGILAINATRIEREYIWPRNWHMVLGRQWIRWNPAAKRWMALPPRPERSCTSNQLIGRVAHMVARMLSGRPTFSVLANNEAPDARRSSIIGEKILEFDWSDLKLYQHRYFATLHMILFGYGLIKYWWDPQWGEVKPKKRTERMPDGTAVTMDSASSFEFQGKIRARAINPSELLTPPGLTWPDLQESPWVIHQTLMTPEEIKLRYDVDVHPEQHSNMGFADGLVADVERFTYYGYAGDTGRTGRVKVSEYYEMPSPQKGFDKGVVITTCQNQILATEMSQFGDGRYPFAMFPGMPEPGRFVPHAWVSDLMGPQIHYNQMLSRLDTWAALAFYPKILNPTTSGIPAHHFRSGGFEILDYDGMSGAKPEWWAPPSPPGQAFQSLQFAVTDLDRISSQFGFGRGEPQGGAPSGALAQVMIEADSTELGPLITMHAREWERLGQGLLELHRRYDPPQKLIALSGMSGPEIMQYKKTDIPVGLRVTVQEDSLQPRIKAARKQELQMMIQTGLFGPPGQIPPKTRLKLLEWSGHPTTNIAKDADMLELELVDAENVLLIEMGKDVPVAPTDDHELHIQGHRERTLLKDRFTWGDVQSSPQWQRMMGHIQQHQQAIDAAQQQNQQQQAQQMHVQAQPAQDLQKAKYDLELRNDLAAKGGEAILAAHAQPDPNDAGGSEEPGQAQEEPDSPPASDAMPPLEDPSSGG